MFYSDFIDHDIPICNVKLRNGAADPENNSVKEAYRFSSYLLF